jgi:transcriptional regulator with GAF, ATPase, and Fis domain
MQPRLVITVGEGMPPVCELQARQSVILGRHRSNTIVLHDRHASRRHAEVYDQDGCWFIRDCGTLNGTRVNGQRIEGPTPLLPGCEIGIGDTRLRFSPTGNGHAADAVARHAPPRPAPVADDSDSAFRTLLQADELSVLCGFMADSLEESCPLTLVERALAVVHSHTWATVTGFLNLDPEEPLPRLVLPEQASVDVHLSRQLTQRACAEGRLVWRRAGDLARDEDSAVSFTDALCVPLRADGAALGALHVYKRDASFTERHVRFCEVLAGHLANSLRLLRERRSLEAENSRLRGRSSADRDALLGSSPALHEVRAHVARVAPRPCTVLIVGESGVGKELVATALHQGSSRAQGPLVTVNCAAIAATLSDAELFGHRKGSFTDAAEDRPGFFAQADEGTLFLDEIGELPPEVQAKLLRVMETKRFRPVGATADVHVDVRVIAATNRNLEEMVRDGQFRKDLYFRLGVPVHVPPLRGHAEDIPDLVEHFLRRLALEYRRPLRLTPAALQRLREYSWPGNVRQLRAVLENAVAMTDSAVLDAGDLRLPDAGAPPGEGFVPLPTLNLEELEIEAIRQALRQTHGNVSAAAGVLGIHRDTLGLKIKRYGITRKEE